MNINYYLLITFLFILWVGGLFDVFKHLRKPRKRKKEWAIFLVMVFVNANVALLWAALLFTQNSIEFIATNIQFIQAQPLLFLFFSFVCLAGIWVVSWNLLNDWIVFRITTTIIFLTAFFVILFANPPIDSSWRILAVAIFLALLALELLLQILTIPGWLPSYSIFQSGMYHPYGRIYQTEEGFTNGLMNRYGLYQPNKKLNLDRNVRRIVLIGGSFIQGFQVKKGQHLSQQLEQMLNDGIDSPVQIFALGIPDAGIGIYMHDLFMNIVIEKFQPDEIILFLHSSSDFQCETCATNEQILYSFSFEDKMATICPETGGIRHALQHIVIRGYYDTWDPLRSIKTHLLLPKFIYAFLSSRPTSSHSKPPGAGDSISTYTASIIRKIMGKREYYQDFIAVPSIPAAGIRNFLFEKEPEAETKKSFAITKSLYQQIFAHLNEKKIKLRMVTIPALSHDFFKQDEQNWSSIVGDYDLFLPEQYFQTFASSKEIDFLGMGAQFQKDQLTLAQIKSYYYQDGLGHFTPDGHQYFAKSINAAFYAPKVNTIN
jgi:hypothetical protein